MSILNYEAYKAYMQKLADVYHSIALLSWDKEVYLPAKGAERRSKQVATLSGIAHELAVSKELGDGLKLLSKDTSLDEKQARNISLSLKDYEKQTKYSTAFVLKKSKAVSEAYHAWAKAKKADNFDLFEKQLTNLVEIKREEADILGWTAHPYDALINQYEPGMTTATLDKLFSDVKQQMVNFVAKIRNKKQVDDSFLKLHYQQDKQWDYGIKILKKMGYDFDAGRQDIAPHPFTINFSSQDVRVTTRIDENDFGNMTWSCIHEGGHALYEQGLPDSEYGLPLGYPCSLSIHESQSRLWENNVGRGMEFWKANYKELQGFFPENLADVTLGEYYKGINKVYPNLIRTESDELHYHFHVLIRFEIEKALIDGSLEVKDAKKFWNDKYKEYLGLEVTSDSDGILQDVHWGHGSFGYFPTYSLGSFYAAQFYQQAVKEIPDLETQLADENNEQLLLWLREKVHQHGRFYTAEELCEKITGERLNFKYFMDYAEKKYSAIYNL